LAELRNDQAAGLRQLLGQRGLRVVTIASGHRRVGKTSLVRNLAAAMARGGREVLVVDENPGAGDGHGEIRFPQRRGRASDQVASRAAGGFAVLSVAGGAHDRGIPGVAGTGSHAPLHRLDVVLIDTSIGMESRLLPIGPAAGEIVVVVVRQGASAVMGSYGLIKALHHEHGLRDFKIVVDRVRDEQEGRVIFDNLAAVARKFLGISPRLLGCVPDDARIGRAARLATTTIEAFPESPAATHYRALAERLLASPQTIGGAEQLPGLFRKIIAATGVASTLAGA